MCKSWFEKTNAAFHREPGGQGSCSPSTLQRRRLRVLAMRPGRCWLLAQQLNRTLVLQTGCVRLLLPGPGTGSHLCKLLICPRAATSQGQRWRQEHPRLAEKIRGQMPRKSIQWKPACSTAGAPMLAG